MASGFPQSRRFYSPSTARGGFVHSRALPAASEVFAAGMLAGRVALVTGGGTGLGRAAAAELVDCALERYGRLDALVNNAGGQYFVPAEAIEPKGWRAVWRLNVVATELMSRVVITLDGARDNWFGPWPPASLTDAQGRVPTEERRRRG